jgi:hypothetical protein
LFRRDGGFPDDPGNASTDFIGYLVLFRGRWVRLFIAALVSSGRRESSLTGTKPTLFVGVRHLLFAW